MSNKWREIANFVRLLDENGELSLSNIAVIVMMVKIALAPTLDMAAAALLLGALGNYQFKRFQAKKKAPEPPSVALASQIAHLERQVGQLIAVKNAEKLLK